MLLAIDEIDKELLAKIEQNNPLSLPNEIIVIYDYQNNIIYSTDSENVLQINATTINKARLNGNMRYTQEPYEVFGAFYTGDFDRIVVFAAATDIFGFSKLKYLRLIMLVVFVASLIAVYFAGKLFSTRALKPILNLIKQVDSIGVSNLSQRVDQGTENDELASLARTFNGMLERLDSAFTIQKNFIANASHELRTPLTVITGQLEVVLLKARTNEEYRTSIANVLSDMKNLNQLSNRLLLLAQASSEPAESSLTQVRIDDILWNARSEILKRTENYSINISFSSNITDGNMLLVLGNELLLKTAVSNLMDNGCKYSKNQQVQITIDANPTHIVLTFMDESDGIPENEQEMIFLPFFRGKNTFGKQGHGLGLSLVEKIVKQHQGSISLSSTTGVGSEFIVKLPFAN